MLRRLALVRCFSTSVLAKCCEAKLEKLVDWVEKQPVTAEDAYVFAHLLKRCSDGRSLEEGRRVHAHLITSGLGSDRLLANLLIGMYGRCGSLSDAVAVFDGVPQKNLFTWTEMIVAYSQNGFYSETVSTFRSMVLQGAVAPDRFIFTVVISAHAQNGHPEEALALFWQMHLAGLKPDSYSATVVLGACTALRALPQGKAIYASIAGTPLESHLIVANCAINMFGKCGSVEDARDAFQRMKVRDVVSWNAIMGTYSQQGSAQDAFRLYRQMQHEGTSPDGITFVSVLEACRCIEQGRIIHAQMSETSSLISDQFSGNALLSMYARCGSLVDAREVFDFMPAKSCITWSAMLTAYTQQDQSGEAMLLARFMNLEGVKPNRVTFLALLAACAHLEDLEQGRTVHAGLDESNVPMETVLETSLVNMYGKCGSLEEARAVLNGMAAKTIVSWNAMVTAYAHHGHGRDALELLKLMDVQGAKPSKVTFVSIVDACAGLAELAEAKRVHARIVEHGLDDDVELGNALVNMYGKCGSLGDARRVFEGMRGAKNVITWNAMIVACTHHGCGKEAVELLWSMDQQGVKPDRITFMGLLTACTMLPYLTQGKAIHARAVACGFDLGLKVGNMLVSLYGRCGCIEEAERAFQALSRKDIVSWNAMLTVYVRNKQSRHQAVQLFHMMNLEGVQPDEVSMAMVLDACAGLSSQALGRDLHARAVACGFDADEVVSNAIVDMYGKCGNLVAARREFDKAGRRDVVCWTSMMAAYAHKGYVEDGMKLFWAMQQDGVKADGIAFLCAVFACSHAGLVRDAFQCFVAMVQDHGLKPMVEHYCCIIDMLGKAGWLSEAEELAQKASALFPGDVPSARALLGACAVHGDSRRGVRAAERVQRINPSSDGLYVLLSNMYAQRSS